MTKELEQILVSFYYIADGILDEQGSLDAFHDKSLVSEAARKYAKAFDKNFISRQELVELADKAKVEAGKSEHPIRAISFNAGIEEVISLINPPISKE